MLVALHAVTSWGNLSGKFRTDARSLRIARAPGHVRRVVRDAPEAVRSHQNQASIAAQTPGQMPNRGLCRILLCGLGGGMRPYPTNLGCLFGVADLLPQPVKFAAVAVLVGLG